MLGQLYLYLIVINYTHTHTHTHGGRQRELIWRNPEFPESRIQISSTQAADLLGTKSRRQISEIIFITQTQNPESQFQILDPEETCVCSGSGSSIFDSYKNDYDWSTANVAGDRILVCRFYNFIATDLGEILVALNGFAAAVMQVRGSKFGKDIGK